MIQDGLNQRCEAFNRKTPNIKSILNILKFWGVQIIRLGFVF